MKKILTTILLGGVFALSGCSVFQGDSYGKRLGQGWVVHNNTSRAVLNLEDRGVISADERADFNSYRQPVYDGLNTATDAWLDDDPTNDGVVDRTLDFLQPLMEEMVNRATKEDDE